MPMDTDRDIATWWDRLDADLARHAANPEIAHDHLRSNDLFDTFWMRMTSLNGYVIAAWLNIPKGDGPFPAIMYPPAYASVVTPAPYEFRTRAITMNVISRGQRGADKPYAAAFPGHLTAGITDPDRYVQRGVVADAIRAWEVLRDVPQADPDRLVMIGTDLALLVEGRRPWAKAIHVSGSFWYRMLEAAGRTDAYPLEEINDHLRTWPEDRDAVARTLAHFDPFHQAGRIGATVLFNRDQASAVTNDAWFAPLVAGMATHAAFYDVTHQGQTDYDAVDAWLAPRLGIDPFPRSWTPEDIGPWTA